MTVRDLIEQLNGFDPDLEVLVLDSEGAGAIKASSVTKESVDFNGLGMCYGYRQKLDIPEDNRDCIVIE